MPALVPAEVLIDRQESLTRACAAISPDELVAIDTEFMRTSQYTPRLCLVQVASSAGVLCVDEIAGLDTTSLWDLLCAGRGLRVLHAGKQDMEVAWVRFRRLPHPLFDTQIGAALVGMPAQIGYAGLALDLLGVAIDKTHTRADWSRRPLGPELISYAALDVLHLPEIYHRLRDRLEKLGRYAWAMEDSARLVDPALYEVDPGEAWHRLGGVGRLPVPAQRRVRRLARWREEYAMRADRPRQWILGDKSLLDIAMRRPRTESELAACTEVPASFARRQSEVVLAELAAADRDEDAGVELVRDARPEVVDPERIRRLGRVVEEVAKSLGIAPEILATRRDLTAALRGEPDIRPLSGWRQAVIGDVLVDAAKQL